MSRQTPRFIDAVNDFNPSSRFPFFVTICDFKLLPAMPPYPGTEENSWFVAVGCTVLAIAAVSSEISQQILPDDFVSHALGF